MKTVIIPSVLIIIFNNIIIELIVPFVKKSKQTMPYRLFLCNIHVEHAKIVIPLQLLRETKENRHNSIKTGHIIEFYPDIPLLANVHPNEDRFPVHKRKTLRRKENYLEEGLY